MSFATRRDDGFYRRLPLAEQPEYQTRTRIDVADVPPLSNGAVVIDVTPRSIQYQDGLHTWFVDKFDKTIVRSYREHRSEEDIEAGAFPVSSFFDDEGGLL